MITSNALLEVKPTPAQILITSPGDLTKEELKKLLQIVREIEQAQPERGVAVVVKVDNLTKDEMKEIIDQLKPKFADVRELPGSSYKPV